MELVEMLFVTAVTGAYHGAAASGAERGICVFLSLGIGAMLVTWVYTGARAFVNLVKGN